MVALAPQTRYGPLRDGGLTSFGDNVVTRLLGQDALDGTVELYFAREDTLPVGFRVFDQVRGGEPVTVTFTTWVEHNGLQLIGEAEFLQGTERFHYRLRDIEVLDAVPDSLLRNPSR